MRIPALTRYLTTILIAASLLALPARATPTVYYLTTGQNGPQTSVDTADTKTWSFAATSNWYLGGGNFDMKIGSGTSANITLNVYQGTSSVGTLLASTTYSTDAFCILHGGNCQNWANTALYFPSAVSIVQGDAYYVTLTSAASAQGSAQYFFKDPGTVSFADLVGNGLPTQTLPSQALTNQTVTAISTSTAAPEPATLALIGSGLFGLRALKRRRSPWSRRVVAG